MLKKSTLVFDNPVRYLLLHQPSVPVIFSCPSRLKQQLQLWNNFPGLVTYAVKANPSEWVLKILWEMGVKTFDVASVSEIQLLRRLFADSVLHYNNPIRSKLEIEQAVQAGVVSYSVDCPSEFKKLSSQVPQGTEIAVRFKLPMTHPTVSGYNFGSKFGTSPENAARLLTMIEAANLVPALTFHPGTQCTELEYWRNYVTTAGEIAKQANMTLKRLNVGGGFPVSGFANQTVDLNHYFDTISNTVNTAFQGSPPKLFCEPGRAIAATSCSLAVQVRALFKEEDGSFDIFLNDGFYGLLNEWGLIGERFDYIVFSPAGALRLAEKVSMRAFGPTCDSLDVLRKPLILPTDTQEGDYILFQAMGAYTTVTQTAFNGYGEYLQINVEQLDYSEILKP